MRINGIEINLFRRFNFRGPWRNEYYFRRYYGPRNEYREDLMEIIVPYNLLFSREQLNIITKGLNKIYKPRQPRSRKG